ncbi:MAG TPA: primary-amine oxidase [Bryobacteraceae bacterium]|nr:primary-amine oxidase [Bryobacteraceae bacterium]
MATPTDVTHEIPEHDGASSHKASMPASHPLDPLTGSELEETVAILTREKYLGDGVRIVSINLIEPAKSVVERYHPGTSFEREALAVLLDRGQQSAREVTVDLVSKSVGPVKQLSSGIQPSIMLDEFAECEQAVRRSPLFQEALRKRGVTDPDLVMVEPWSAGMYGTELPEDQGLRRMRALCFVRSEAKDNGYARPVDSMVIVVDLYKMEVLRIEEYVSAPLPPESGNWAREYIPNVRKDLKPLEIVQPEGPSFTVEGNLVQWQKWKFRVGFTSREGLVLHTISYTEDGMERPVLYRASICEMVVPYGDPREQYYRKNAFDIGEYGLGMLANSLSLGCDCLGVIYYFDFPLVDSHGKIAPLKNAVCLHEEDFGILWKHTDWRTGQTEVRRSRRLSVSFIATVGNYEYAYYWYFYQDGSIQCEIKLTGIMNTTALAPGERPLYGTEVAPQLNAPFHQHIFAARLVPCVDGPNNSVYEINSVGVPTGPSNPHGNAFVAEETLLGTEQSAQRRVNSATARFWRVVNPNKKNRLGRPVGYRLVPGENCPPLVQPDAAVMRRAGFTSNHVWVTPYSPEERFAAGDYPNQHPTGDGLPFWTKANRNVDNTELSLWYVFAHNHVPRPEDWPVMPAAMLGFQFRPDGFFERSAAMDVPPPPPKACCH